MTDLISIAAMGVVGLAIIGYMIRSSAQEARELGILMKQQTDQLITEGNKRLEMSLAESRRLHEENMARSQEWMKELGYKTEQIFERVDKPEKDS